ncbi:MAG: response regulator transcription factor [Campylobacterota bacterium]|nr:response regulator transcription factor [Campylobacterota bacterium]
MKILLVEDNQELNRFITDTFEKMGYDIMSCIGEDSKEIFKVVENNFDLYIIDINLPDINGLELVKKIKLKNNNAKIFIISGDDNIDTVLKAYDIGCDDYIKKPFDLREVIAKINLNFQNKIEKHIILSDECYYDTDLKMLFYNKKPITLTTKESLLFGKMIENIGKTVMNKELDIAVWGKENSSGHLRQLISKLKRALPCSDIIQNHSSNGYGIIPTK